jgi:hypothetical protein
VGLRGRLHRGRGTLVLGITSHFVTKSEAVKPSVALTKQSATAGDGGIAINASGGSTVVTSSASDGGARPQAQASQAAPAPAIDQTAVAGKGGQAVNANGGSVVQSQPPPSFLSK